MNGFIKRRDIEERQERTASEGAMVRFSKSLVTFDSGRVKLAGKLFLPEAKYPVPGAVLCHGLGSNYKVLEPSARLIAGHGVATLIFDLRGHGDSGGAFDGNMVEDVIRAWQFLSRLPQVDSQHIAIVGHSIGAVAAILASRQVMPRALVALSCPPETPASWLAKPIALACPVWKRFAGFQLNANWQAFFQTLTKMKLSLVLSELRACSKLFVHCRGDHLTPYQLALRLYEKASSPKDLLLFEKGSHSAPLCSGRLHRRWIKWTVATLMN